MPWSRGKSLQQALGSAYMIEIERGLRRSRVRWRSGGQRVSVVTQMSKARTGRTPPYEIRGSKIQGRGVFATRRIRPGQRIIEYAGQRISDAEADRRYDEDTMRRHHTYLFIVDKNVVVDGNRQGNDARYINHSCDPNCETCIEDGRIFIHALRNIQPGIELSYDYMYDPEGESIAELRRLYPCRCGAAKCRGTIAKPKARRRRRRQRRRSATRR